MTTPTPKQLEQWLTGFRYKPYLSAAHRDHDAAVRLYEWNTDVSSAFLQVFAFLEVLLRNAVDTVLRPLEVPSSARISASEGWWFANGAFVTAGALTVVASSRDRLVGDGRYDRDKVLSNLTFGFWDGLFGPEYEELFRQHLHQAFPHRPSTMRRKHVSRALSDLRKLRNRIAHHEPVHEYPLAELLEQAMALIGAIDPAARSWVESAVRASSVVGARPVPPEPLAVVVPAKRAWPLYSHAYAYVCQPGRFFRNVSHVAFYADGAVQPEVARITDRRDDVPWNAQEIGRLMGTRDPRDREFAAIVKTSREQGWDDARYQVFLLTKPGERGHVTLPAAIPNTKRGVGSGFVRKQRYASVAALQVAVDTDGLGIEFDPQAPEGGSGDATA